MSINNHHSNIFKITPVKPKYTLAKLYIPKKLVNGKQKPDLDTYWYVWFRFQNPETGKMEKFNMKLDINRLKSVSERKAYGKNLVASYNEMLASGYSPFPDKKITINNRSLNKILDYALQIKSKSVNENTLNGYKTRVNVFLDWCDKNGLKNIDISDFTFDHALGFINHFRYNKKKNITGTSIDNYRRELSTIFEVLKKDRVIQENFFKSIETKPSAPKRHSSFTPQQVLDIKKYLVENDKHLYHFITVMLYSFLRNRETVLLRVRDIDLSKRLIATKTKTEVLSYKLITDNVHKLLTSEYDIKNSDPEDFLFTNKIGSTGEWNVSVKRKLKFFSDKFNEVRKALNLSNEYTIYSFRHTVILDIFGNLLKETNNEREAIFKLMSITGHISEGALRKYLRKIGAILPTKADSYTTIGF